MCVCVLKRYQVCGKPVYRWPKIVSGENARLGQWPWQVKHTKKHKKQAFLKLNNWNNVDKIVAGDAPRKDETRLFPQMWRFPFVQRLGHYGSALSQQVNSFHPFLSFSFVLFSFKISHRRIRSLFIAVSIELASSQKACWSDWAASISPASKTNGWRVVCSSSLIRNSIFKRSRTILPYWSYSRRSLHTNRACCPSACRTRTWNSMGPSLSSPDGEDLAKVILDFFQDVTIKRAKRITIEFWADEFSESPISTRLQYVGVPIINNTECQKIYQPINKQIDRQSICAGYAEGLKDSCEVSNTIRYVIPIKNRNPFRGRTKRRKRWNPFFS